MESSMNMSVVPSFKLFELKFIVVAGDITTRAITGTTTLPQAVTMYVSVYVVLVPYIICIF